MAKNRSWLVTLIRTISKNFLILFIKIQAYFLLKHQDIQPANITRILIFGYMGIGDMIMFTPALKQLRAHFPQARITLQTGLGNSCEQVVLNSNLIDDVQEINLNSGLLKFIRCGLHRRNKYDLLISEFHNPYFQLALQILYMNIPLRLGHVSSPGFTNPFDFLFNYPVKMKEAQHTLERNLSLLKIFNIPFNLNIEKEKTAIFLSPADKAFAETFREKKELNQHVVIGIQAGTAPLGRWKQWPLTHFTKLIQQLQSRGARVILFGSPSERGMLKAVADQLNPSPILFAGDGSFLQSCALIKKCNYMITNDSGLMHVANALAVPLTAIYGPTDHRRTAPLGKNSKMLSLGLSCSPCFKLEGDAGVTNCPYNIRCLQDISVNMVLKTLPDNLFAGNQSRV